MFVPGFPDCGGSGLFDLGFPDCGGGGRLPPLRTKSASVFGGLALVFELFGTLALEFELFCTFDIDWVFFFDDWVFFFDDWVCIVDDWVCFFENSFILCTSYCICISSNFWDISFHIWPFSLSTIWRSILFTSPPFNLYLNSFLIYWRVVVWIIWSKLKICIFGIFFKCFFKPKLNFLTINLLSSNDNKSKIYASFSSIFGTLTVSFFSAIHISYCVTTGEWFNLIINIFPSRNSRDINCI